MAGIYIHIPFCKKKCPYCDFYSVGVTGKLDHFHKLIIKELELRKEFLGNQQIETIYFGGGTPSVLKAETIGDIISFIFNNFDVAKNPEITIEVNPDDVDKELLIKYQAFHINRISIGVQSFDDSELQILGRRHTALKAMAAIKLLQDLRFSNISIDLIYGIPGSTISSWETSLRQALEYNITHLSCYHLTFEEGTPFYRKLIRNEISPVNEELSKKQYELLINLTKENSYTHYEISNFAKDGYFSRHNSSYWKGLPYLGVGPSAHSYRPYERFWNPKSYNTWKEMIDSEDFNLEGEALDFKTQYNELILTRLRTIYGVSLVEIQSRFGADYTSHFVKNAKKYMETGLIVFHESLYRIPQKHYLISDSIVSDLMII